MAGLSMQAAVMEGSEGRGERILRRSWMAVAREAMLKNEQYLKGVRLNVSKESALEETEGIGWECSFNLS